MRAFVAIDIPNDIKNEIIKIQKTLPEFSGKKTGPGNLHLTLKFLGEADEKEVKTVKDKLNLIKVKRFETEVDRIGFFDNINSGIVWLHMADCGELQKEIDEALKSLFLIEKRFMSHLTIARVKQVKDKSKFLKELHEIEFDKIRFEVKNFKLKESVLTKNGSVYRDIEVYDLK